MFGELRLETLLSVLFLLLHLLFFLHTHCSCVADYPRVQVSAQSFHCFDSYGLKNYGNPPSNPYLKAPGVTVHWQTWRLWFVYTSGYPLWHMNTFRCTVCKVNAYIHTRAHAHDTPCLSFLRFFDWQCLLLQGIIVENRGVGPGEGWWEFEARVRESEKEDWGLDPLSFINLNVYTSWSLAMRPFSFPQVSPSRICCPFLHPLKPIEAMKPASQAWSPCW